MAFHPFCLILQVGIPKTKKRMDERFLRYDSGLAYKVASPSNFFLLKSRNMFLSGNLALMRIVFEKLIWVSMAVKPENGKPNARP